MKAIIAAALVGIAIASPASADVAMVGRAPLNGGAAVFELYMEPAMLPECRGTNASAMIAKLDTPRGIIPYGTGCWIAGNDGNVYMLVKSFEDGRIRETRMHNSHFSAPAADHPTGKAKQLIDRVDRLDNQCRGGSGDDPKTMQACDQREAALAQVRNAGWCWGPDDAIGADKRWIRCR